VPGHTPFAVFNRTANPVLKAVLSSPFHPLLSRNLALITVTGRRTGGRYTFPVAYHQADERVTINVGWPERKRWWRNLTDGEHVELRIRGARRSGQARARGDERTGVTVEIELDGSTGS
jgi:deazaflavin-dependent oxidoreductase (nitroreductase family)